MQIVCICLIALKYIYHRYADSKSIFLQSIFLQNLLLEDTLNLRTGWTYWCIILNKQLEIRCFFVTCSASSVMMESWNLGIFILDENTLHRYWVSSHSSQLFRNILHVTASFYHQLPTVHHHDRSSPTGRTAQGTTVRSACPSRMLGTRGTRSVSVCIWPVLFHSYLFNYLYITQIDFVLLLCHYLFD